MNYTTIFQKANDLISMAYKGIIDKFTSPYKKLKDNFLALNQYPLLKYSLIPVLIGLFFLARYIIKLVIDELAAWTSGVVGEISGYSISERTIVLSIAAVFIILRLIAKLRSKKKEKVAELELNYESTK